MGMASLFVRTLFQIRVCHRFAEHQRAFRAEVQAGVREVGGLDDRQAWVGAGEFVEGGVDRVHVAPWGVLVLLGDEPGELGLLEVGSRLVDQLLHPLRVVVGVGTEVRVVLAGVPEDACEAAVMALLLEVVLSRANEVDELRIEVAMRLVRAIRKPIGALCSAVRELDDGHCFVGCERLLEFRTEAQLGTKVAEITDGTKRLPT